LLQAAGGLISVTGQPEAGKQVRVGVSIVDICSGLYTFSGVLTAIIDRNRTGLGKRVDTTMLSVVANLMENPISRFAATGVAPEAQGLAHPVVSPFNVYTTSDGSIYVAIANTARYKHLVNALGREDLATDPRFAENDQRMKHKDELEAILNELFSSKTTAEWEKLLIPNGVPVSAINDVKTLTERHPEAFVKVNHPVAGTQSLPGPPTVFSDATVDASVPAPRLGEHTDEILTMLGYSTDAINNFHKNGIV
jgi:crotonobetainyl-CoA:carnitine CoA-transferase CaiB-like acyl-CoA transferase